MVILFLKFPDEFIRNIGSYLYRGTLDKCPVVAENLIPDPYDPVCFFYCVVVVDVEFSSEIKEENVRIGLHVIIRKRNDYAGRIILEIEKVRVRLPKSDLIFRLNESRLGIQDKILVKIRYVYAVILVEKITQLKTVSYSTEEARSTPLLSYMSPLGACETYCLIIPEELCDKVFW